MSGSYISDKGGKENFIWQVTTGAGDTNSYLILVEERFTMGFVKTAETAKP
jgi:hypothetical protein